MTSLLPSRSVDRLTLAGAARIYHQEALYCDRTWMYAIQAGHSGPVKLGLAVNPAARLKTLQTANADLLRLLGAWAAYGVEEKILHEQFAYARIRGEWFRPVPELLDVIAKFSYYDDWEPA